MRALVVITSVMASAACGGPAPPAAPAIPDTGSDPVPYAPPPRARAESGQAVGLALSGGRAQALGLMRRFFEAVRDRDRSRLRALLAERLARVNPRLSPPVMPREARIRQLLDARGARRARLAPGARPESYFRFDAARVRPLASVPGQVPGGFSPSDLLVRVPAQPGQEQALEGIVRGWSRGAAILVRTGAEPVILGL